MFYLTLRGPEAARYKNYSHYGHRHRPPKGGSALVQGLIKRRIEFIQILWNQIFSSHFHAKSGTDGSLSINFNLSFWIALTYIIKL